MDVNNRRSRARDRARARARARFQAKWVNGTEVDAGAFVGVDAGVTESAYRSRDRARARVRSRARARARAQARFQSKWVDGTGDVAGVDAGVIENPYRWNELRQMIVNKITETLVRLLPDTSLGVQEVMKIAVRFEEKIYTATTTSQRDYLRQISSKMVTLENKAQNPMTYDLHPNAASGGRNVHGPEMTMEATSYKTTSGPEENDEEQAAEEDDGDVSKEDVEEEVVVKKEQNYVVGHEENVRVGENEISYGFSAGAKLDERLVQVEERLEKMEAHSEKMVTLENKSQNLMTNYLHPNAASSGQNVHGPEMTMEAISYKTTSGPEESDEEQAAEEDAGDMSKEDVVEEVVVKKEQNYVVGHKENVTVGENEISYGLNSGAILDERLVQVEERLEKIEAHSEKVETLLVDINKKLNYLVKMQDIQVSRDIRRPTKYMSSSWTGNGRSNRKHRVAELIRQSCKHRRLGRGDKGVVHPVALHDDCVENDQR